MGFSGGGSNVTKPHTHDSNIVQDGGSLAANVTQFGLTAGSILYSDGANIQELAVGSASDTLTVNGAATAPEWGAPPGAGAWVNLGTGYEATPAATISLAVDDYDILEVFYNCSINASAVDPTYMSATINGVTANYRSMWSYSSGGAFTTSSNTGASMWRLNGSNIYNLSTSNTFGQFTLFKPQTASMVDMVSIRTINGYLGPTGTNSISTSFGSCAETEISSIQLKAENSTIQGSFTVNGMNFS